jgi:hypothetical protein
MEGQGVGVGVVAAAVVVYGADTLTHSKHSLYHTAYTYSPHTYIIHKNKQKVPLSRRPVSCSTWMQVPVPQARCP